MRVCDQRGRLWLERIPLAKSFDKEKLRQMGGKLGASLDLPSAEDGESREGQARLQSFTSEAPCQILAQDRQAPRG